MRTYVLLALSLLLAGCSAMASPAPVERPKSELRGMDLMVRGIFLYEPAKSVKERLGEPKARNDDTWVYDGLTVTFSSGEFVKRIEVTGHGVGPMGREIRVGDDLGKIYEAFGEPGTIEPMTFKSGEKLKAEMVIKSAFGKVASITVQAV